MRRSTSSSLVCVDANLVFRRVAEPDDRATQELWNRWVAARQQFAAPTLLYYEVTNALHRAQRHGVLSALASQKALAAALALPIQLHGAGDLHQAAAELAARFGLPATYDAH